MHIIAHIFFPFNDRKGIFFRTILSISQKYHDLVEYHLIIPKTYNLDNIKKYHNYDFLKIHQVSNYINITNLINPNSIILSVSPRNDFINHLLANIKCKNIYYIQHGFFVPSYTYNLITWSNKINYIMCDQKQQVYLPTSILHKSFKVSGLPQIDMLMNNIDNIKKKRPFYEKLWGIDGKHKTIILIIGGNAPAYTGSASTYLSIMKIAKQVFNDPFFIIKLKYTPIPGLNTDHSKNIHILYGHDFIYDYQFADINIVQEGSTTFFESLMINYNTILYQNENKQGHFNYHIPNNSSLMVSKTNEQLLDYLKNIKYDKLDTDQIIVDKLDLFHNFIGPDFDVHQKVSDTIIDRFLST